MAVVVGFSSDAASSPRTESWLLPILTGLAPWATSAQLEALHWLVRKIAHLSEYAILAALWLRALVRGRGLSPWNAGLIALAISAAWAALDEVHQSFVPSRSASVADVALDTTGALVALAIAGLGWRRVADRTAATLLWTALIGGAAFLIVNALAGVPSGALWFTAPAAGFAPLARTMHARHRSRRP